MKFFITLFSIIFFFSCQSDKIKKPKDLIEKNKMGLIMRDMILMKSISRNYIVAIKNKNWFGDKYIYEKYKIDSLQLIKSLNYYAKSPKIYLDIHNDIKTDLQRLMDSIAVEVKEEIRKEKEFEGSTKSKN
jgi:hypothetical protein